MTGRCTRWQRWLPGSGGGLKELNWNLHSFQLLDIIQVLNSISLVLCASGNVYIMFQLHLHIVDCNEPPAAAYWSSNVQFRFNTHTAQ